MSTQGYDNEKWRGLAKYTTVYTIGLETLEQLPKSFETYRILSDALLDAFADDLCKVPVLALIASLLNHDFATTGCLFYANADGSLCREYHGEGHGRKLIAEILLTR